MKIKEIQTLNCSDLETKILEMKKNLTLKKMAYVKGELKDSSELFKIRKTIARLKTVYNQKLRSQS